MPFQVSIVLTGATLVNPNIDVFSNPVSNINHGTFVTTVTKTCLTTNSPCTISVPDGTVTVRLRDSGSYCYWDLPTCSSDVCNTCNLGFANILDNQVGTVSIGNLTGSCDNSIDDFRVEWLGPNSLTITGFTSGKGTQYAYSNTHPLIGQNAPLLPPGSYVSRITNVNLNNVKFSSISGLPGHVYSPTLSACSTTVNVTSLTCANGNVPLDQYYKHQKSYSATNPLVTPDAVNTFFQLSAGTNFFVFEFTGYEKWDILRLTLTGSTRPIPIILEDYKVGSDSPGNIYTPTTFPKSTTRQTVRKIITLTGLTITNTDSIKIELTPNTSTNNTSWVFKCSCRDSITYEKNCLNTYKNKPYRIIQSSLSKSTPTSCQEFSINFQVSGCSSSQLTGWDTSDFKYLIGYSTSQTNLSGNINGIQNLSVGTFYPSYISYNDQWVSYPDVSCSATTGNYTHQKLTGLTPTGNKIVYNFSNISDFNNFQTGFNNAKNSVYPSWSTSTNTNENYYQYIRYYYVYGTSATQVCYDGGVFYIGSYDFAPNAVMTTQTVAGPYPYQVEITTPTMTYNPTIFTGVCSTNIWDNKITSINNFATGTTMSVTTVTSKNIPKMSFGTIKYNKYTQSSRTSDTEQGYLQLSPTYDFYTYPAYSNTIPPTLIPSFSGSPFPEQRYIDEFNGPPNSLNYSQQVFYYSFNVTSFAPNYNYEIYAQDISNYTTTNYHKIYDSTLPNPVIDPNFFL